MHHFQETDWAVPPQPPLTIDEDGVLRDPQRLGVLMVLASWALSIAALVAMVQLMS
jgi:hypothetical protein